MAKMSTADIIKQILSMATGAAMSSYGGPVGGAAGVLAGVRIPASGTKERDYTASEYPTEFAPGENHEYDVQWVALPKGSADMNSMGKANMDLVKDAGIMQTKEAHNAALTKYLRPGMNPAQQYLAIQKGREEEKQLPQFWNESYSRLRTVSESRLVEPWKYVGKVPRSGTCSSSSLIPTRHQGRRKNYSRPILSDEPSCRSSERASP